MDNVLKEFRKEALTALGDDLVCLLHHGSRVKGEAHAESDYDVIIVVKKTDAKILSSLRKVIKRHANLSTYLLTLRDLQTLPKGHLLEFTYARPLYGTMSVDTPLPEMQNIISVTFDATSWTQFGIFYFILTQQREKQNECTMG